MAIITKDVVIANVMYKLTIEDGNKLGNVAKTVSCTVSMRNTTGFEKVELLAAMVRENQGLMWVGNIVINKKPLKLLTCTATEAKIVHDMIRLYCKDANNSFVTLSVLGYTKLVSGANKFTMLKPPEGPNGFELHNPTYFS